MAAAPAEPMAPEAVVVGPFVLAGTVAEEAANMDLGVRAGGGRMDCSLREVCLAGVDEQAAQQPRRVYTPYVRPQKLE